MKVSERYFQALLKQLHEQKRPTISLRDPGLTTFAELSSRERAKYVVDIQRLKSTCTLSVVSLEMNAGLGTSLGLDPASDASKASGVTFQTEEGETLSILEAKLLWAAEHAPEFRQLGIIPWNSERTQRSWDRVVAKRKPALKRGGVHLYDHQIQGFFPRFHAGTTNPLDRGRPEDRVAPGGHGLVLFQLYGNGTLKTLSDEGVEVLVLANSDNIQAVPHPALCRYLCDQDLIAAMLTTDRTEADAKGGIIALHHGKLTLLEVAQIPKEERDEFQRLGLRQGDAPQPFNTNVLYLHLPRLKECLVSIYNQDGEEGVYRALTPTLVVNRKQIVIEGEETEVDQLEGAIGSVVLRFPGVKLFNVPASERRHFFIPIKTREDIKQLTALPEFSLQLSTSQEMS